MHKFGLKMRKIGLKSCNFGLKIDKFELKMCKIGLKMGKFGLKSKYAYAGQKVTFLDTVRWSLVVQMNFVMVTEIIL